MKAEKNFNINLVIPFTFISDRSKC